MIMSSSTDIIILLYYAEFFLSPYCPTMTFLIDEEEKREIIKKRDNKKDIFDKDSMCLNA